MLVCGLTIHHLPSNRLRLLANNKDQKLDNDNNQEEGKGEGGHQ
jgi:hypothetical protein